MTPDLIIFIFLAIVAIASALGMLLSRSAVYSALNLIINFGTVAILYLILGASFIALVQVTVYAGAIMVLFLFVIMLLGDEKLLKGPTLPWQQPLAIISALILIGLSVYVIFLRPATTLPAGAIQPGFGSPTAVGITLFRDYLLPFEVTSVLLLVAMIGAIVLTRRRENKEKSS